MKIKLGRVVAGVSLICVLVFIGLCAGGYAGGRWFCANCLPPAHYHPTNRVCQILVESAYNMCVTNGVIRTNIYDGLDSGLYSIRFKASSNLINWVDQEQWSNYQSQVFWKPYIFNNETLCEMDFRGQ